MRKIAKIDKIKYLIENCNCKNLKLIENTMDQVKNALLIDCPI